MLPRPPIRSEVNVYSYRQPYLIDPLFKKFTEETGIKVNVIFAEKGLIERMAAEGRNSPADLLLTVDVGNLMQAKEAGIGQVGPLGGPGEGDPGGLSRQRRNLVGPHPPRSRRLCLEGSGEARRHHL